MLLAAAAFAQDIQRQVVTEGSGFFPVAIRLKNGHVLAVLRGGAPHIGVKGRLDLVRSTNNGKTWSKPWTVADGEFDDRNPAFGQLRDGTLILGYAIASGYDASGLKFAGPRQNWRFDGVYVIRSADNGKAWSAPQRDTATFDLYQLKGAISPYGKIVQHKDGTALMAVYYEFHDARGNESYVFRSKDGGKTWGEHALIAKHYNETALAVLPDGRVLAALRSEKGGHIATAESADGGRTWSAPVQVTADREHPADLIVLRDGRVVMTFGERNAPRGAKAILSKDGGKTWDKSTLITLGDDAPNGDCGYPSSVEVGKNRILTLFYQVNDLGNALATSRATAVAWTAK
jgi:Neuraminidase (sialidase)